MTYFNVTATEGLGVLVVRMRTDSRHVESVFTSAGRACRGRIPSFPSGSKVRGRYLRDFFGFEREELVARRNGSGGVSQLQLGLRVPVTVLAQGCVLLIRGCCEWSLRVHLTRGGYPPAVCSRLGPVAMLVGSAAGMLRTAGMDADLADIPSFKRRRMETLMMEIGRFGRLRYDPEVAWQVMIVPGDAGAGAQWADLNKEWSILCEHTYEGVCRWTDGMFNDTVRRDGVPSVPGDNLGYPHHVMEFRKTGIVQVNKLTGTVRPVRRVIVTAGSTEVAPTYAPAVQQQAGGDHTGHASSG